MNDFEKKLVDFKEIILGLQDILNKENKALETFDTKTAASYFDMKNKSVTLYRELTSYFIKNNEQLKEAKQEDKDLLKKMITDLNTALSRNDVLLKTRIEVSKNVMNTVVSIAKKKNSSEATSYGHQGKYSQREKQYSAMAINKIL